MGLFFLWVEVCSLPKRELVLSWVTAFSCSSSLRHVVRQTIVFIFCATRVARVSHEILHGPAVGLTYSIIFGITARQHGNGLPLMQERTRGVPSHGVLCWKQGMLYSGGRVAEVMLRFYCFVMCSPYGLQREDEVYQWS